MKHPTQVNLFYIPWFSPGHTVHSLLVDWRNNEADRGHHCLVTRVVQDLPFEWLGVVEESALICFMDSDLQRDFQNVELPVLTRGSSGPFFRCRTYMDCKLRSRYVMSSHKYIIK